jgi:hypothetical protein
VTAVAYNVFLDGRLNGNDDDVDVEKRPLVAEGRIGATVSLGAGFRVVIAQVFRTEEFLRQSDPQSYTSASFVFGMEF